MALQNAERAESASIDWRQQNDISQLQLTGPMGLGATTVYADASTLEVTQGGESRRYDVSTPELAQAQTGWDLPVQALQYWLKGVPSPELDIQQKNVEHGLLKLLQQAHWTCTFKPTLAEISPWTCPAWTSPRSKIW
jgi:outer membrane lipoprotein LolB